ncbi:MAG: ribonuclease HI [Clostridiales bacterium]|nr:ribonuclease HI [Clostridiales bacterium]
MASELSRVTIYADGACSGNPGPGGWGAVLLWNDQERRLQGRDRETTNNRMELVAAIKALEALKRPCQVDLYSDSAYLVNAFTLGWITRWQANGWKTTKKEPVENQDLWQRLLALDAAHEISWHKVKGHAGDVYNTICDAMATEEAALASSMHDQVEEG